MHRERLALAGLLLATCLVRLVHLDRPIVENYVGRQIPTAMVARNLGRGSGFLHPQLDTGPFPNLFLVEPPIFASLVVLVRSLTNLPIGASGRAVSALATTLTAWGLFGLARRREGMSSALIAVMAFGLFPITLRYGRGCQPDMLMMGLWIAGLRVWDDFEAEGGAFRLVSAWGLVASGLAVKVVSAYLLIPLMLGILRPPRWRKLGIVTSTLIPALLWYGYVGFLLKGGEGSRASADNASIWAGALGPLALFHPETLRTSARFLFWRAFTPLGFALAAWGFLRKRNPDRLWIIWAASACAGLALVAGKIHHEYYWLALSPIAAIGLAKAFRPPSPVSGPLFPLLAMLCLYQSAETWQTPPEWAGLARISGEIRRIVPADSLPIAPEAVLFAADARGCRLEFEPKGMTRAAGEWGGSIDPSDPLALVEFYRRHGAKFVADLETPADPPSRRDLHEAIRRRYNVRVDRDGVLIAELTERQGIAAWPPPLPP